MAGRPGSNDGHAGFLRGRFLRGRFLAPVFATLLALASIVPTANSAVSTDLEARVAELERQVAALCAATAGTCVPPPSLTDVAADQVTSTEARVSWTVSEPASGQVEYGATTAYGSVSVPETSFAYATHRQVLTGLTPATTYHYRVRSTTQAGVTVVSGDNTLTTLPPATAVTGNLRDDRYGPGVGFTSKGNVRIGPDGLSAVAVRLIASSSDVVSVGLQIRLGSAGGYSAGSGGDWRYGIQADAGGAPSGLWLGSGRYPTGQSSGPYNRYFHLPVAARVTPGKPIWVVVEDADPSSFASLNLAYSSRANPQPAFSDQVAVRVLRSGGWTTDGGPGVGSMSRYTPVVDVTYADGRHDGAQFHEAMITYARSVGGAASVRERFTAKRTLKVTGAGVFMATGTPGRLELWNANGNVMAATSTLREADGFHVATFATPVTLIAGQAYSLVVAGGSGTVHPMRAVWDEDAAFYGGTGARSAPWASYGFTEGVGEYTTGGSWLPMYGQSPQHLMCYLEVVPE